MPATRRATARQVLSAGPWKGVRTTQDPYDDNPDLLYDAQNLYIPDPVAGSGAYARPGFVLVPSNAPIFSSGTPFRGQGVFTHLAVDGTSYNFLVMGGRLFRANTALSVFTDVTPVAPIAISASITTRVQFASINDQMVVSDGVNTPWIAGNLGSTPITGTRINYDSLGTAWSMQHMVVWGGALVGILKLVGGVSRQSDISWSEPGQPAVGWQQTDFDNNWTLEQTGGAPLFALAPTNVALYYFRRRSIGAITGAIGPDLATTATHDAISVNVGTECPASVQLYGDLIFFTDTMGRPWAMRLGAAPEAIWLNMRDVVDQSTTAFPSVTAVTTTTAMEPTLNLYLAAIWSPLPASQKQPNQIYVFDARNNAYNGRWQLGGDAFPFTTAPVGVDCIGTFIDSNGRTTLIVLGTAGGITTNGFVWAMRADSGAAAGLATENLVSITTEDGRDLTTEAQGAVWTDNQDPPIRSATTQRLGFSPDAVWNIDRCVVITGNQAPIRVNMLTPTFFSLEGIPTINASADSSYRAVVGCSAVGRSAMVTVRPVTADSQWRLESLQLVGVPSTARPEDA